MLSGRGRLDDLEDELSEVPLLDDGSGGQPLGDVSVEDQNQAELDTVAFAGRQREAGDGELRGGARGIRGVGTVWGGHAGMVLRLERLPGGVPCDVSSRALRSQLLVMTRS